MFHCDFFQRGRIQRTNNEGELYSKLEQTIQKWFIQKFRDAEFSLDDKKQLRKASVKVDFNDEISTSMESGNKSFFALKIIGQKMCYTKLQI